MFTAIGSRLGNTILAANAILIMLQMFISYSLDGFAQAAEVLIGNEYSKKNKDKVSTSYSVLNKTDVIIICLPTPLKPNLKPDLSYIKLCLKKIKPFLRKGQTLSLESSTYPGTTEELILPYLKKFTFIEYGAYPNSDGDMYSYLPCKEFLLYMKAMYGDKAKTLLKK